MRFLMLALCLGACTPVASSPSPTPSAIPHFAQLVEVTTGRVFEVGEGMPTGWTSRGEIVLVGLL